MQWSFNAICHSHEKGILTWELYIVDNTLEEKTKLLKLGRLSSINMLFKIISKFLTLVQKREIDIAFIVSLSVDDKIIYVEKPEESIGKYY